MTYDQPATLFPLPPQSDEGLKSFESAVLERRSTAHFLPDHNVPDEVVEAVLAAGAQAPSGFNLQPWRFLVLRDPERRAALRRAAMDQPKITEAPVVIVAFAPHHEWEETAGEVFAEGARRGAISSQNIAAQARQAVGFVKTMPLDMWLNRHTMIAFTYMMIAAEVMGWDTAPMEGFNSDAVRDELGFPPDTAIIALLAIGRLEGGERPYPGRLPLSRLVYAEDLKHPWRQIAAVTS